MTVSEAITLSLKSIGVLAAGESAQGSEFSDSLLSLNAMLKSWANENMAINGIVREEFTLTAGTGRYSVGSGGDFNTTRPQFYESVAIEIQSGDFPELSVNVVGLDEWSKIADKNVQGDRPILMWSENKFPLDYINLWPVPSTGNKIVLYSKKELGSFSSSGADIEFPPGYEEAIVYNLCVRLAGQYGKTVSPEVAALARDSKALVKRKNVSEKLMISDAAGLTRRAAGFNIKTGG